MKLRFAIDFDGTLFKWAKYPEVGDVVPHALETVKALQKAGHDLTLWTCREDIGLEKALAKLEEHGLEFTYINDHCYSSRKIDADFFIDDKALGCPLVHTVGKSYVDWLKVREFLVDNEVP